MAQAITNHKRDYEAERLRRRLRQEFKAGVSSKYN